MAKNTARSMIGGALVIVATTAGTAGAGCVNFDLLVERAVSADAADAEAAIASLRGLGPRGLAAIVERHADSIAAYKASIASPQPCSVDPQWDRIARALDGVGRQCDNFSACLYWYTDLEQAKAASQQSGKPILSLRLLGRLDEDRSCANSRFIRTALYANETVSKRLRDGFVLHWESVRPVPTITIDFGDGRRIARTITGNSIHYVLDGEGRPIEALPGLCGPEAFLAWLGSGRSLHDRLRADPSWRQQLLRRYHGQRFERVVSRWRRDLDAIGGSLEELPTRVFAKVFPTALEAAPVAVTKAAIELPMIRAMLPEAERLLEETPDEVWDDLAALHLDGARLDGGSLTLMAAKVGGTPSPETVERFERSIALDTVQNEFLLHRRIHEWFARLEVDDLAELNDRVYAELFLTPGSDPWLGLLPADTYAGLNGNGVVAGEVGPRQ